MKLRNLFLVSFLSLFISTILSSQSLVELSKKEKERRARLKGKKVVVITNADLKKFKREPAISVRNTITNKKKTPIPSYTLKSRPSTKRPFSKVGEPTGENLEYLNAIEKKLEKAREYVGLLTLKMNALWQEFYSLDDMKSRDSIQREISETYLKLQKAQQDKAKIREELDNLKNRIR